MKDFDQPTKWPVWSKPSEIVSLKQSSIALIGSSVLIVR